MGNRKVAFVVVAALAVGWLAVPRIASAVGSLVTIQNGAGTAKAGVTKGQQLQVAEAGPGSFREFRVSVADQNCHAFVTVPSTKGFVVRSISVIVLSSSASVIHAALLYPNAGCNGLELYSASTGVEASHDFTVDPGFAIAHGGSLSIRMAGDGVVAVYVWGYFVPKADVPITTSIG
jgi:hypothetical protein